MQDMRTGRMRFSRWQRAGIRAMPFAVGVSLLLTMTTSRSAPPDKPDASLCGEAMSVYLPEPQGTPAPNIRLEHFQTMSPDDPCVRNLDHDEAMRLHDGIKAVAAAAFADSPSAFGVMVRYTLTPDEPATFDMRTLDAAEADRPRLSRFHAQASALTDFHASSGTVYVVFQYAISPAGDGKATDAR